MIQSQCEAIASGRRRPPCTAEKPAPGSGAGAIDLRGQPRGLGQNLVTRTPKTSIIDAKLSTEDG
jgi:hypothetical protein